MTLDSGKRIGGTVINCGRSISTVAACALMIVGCGSPEQLPIAPDLGSPSAAATHLAFSSQPPSTVTATQSLGTIRVTLLTASGGTATGSKSAVSISLSSSDPAAQLAGTTTVNAVGGVAEFTDLSVARAGTDFKLVATSTGLDPGTSLQFGVMVGPASKLKFDLLGTFAAGAQIPAVVRVTDAGGNPVTDVTTDVTVTPARVGSYGLTVAPDDAVGPVTATAVNGVASVSGLAFHKSGVYSLSASAPGLSGSTTFSVLGTTITRLVFLKQPQTGSPSTVLPTFSVLQVDDYGNGSSQPLGAAYDVSLQMGNNQTGAVLGGTLTAHSPIAVSTADFTTVTIDRAGTGYTLVATSGKKTVTSEPFDIR